ncbi:DNA-3-methyladenine glycosylase I [Planococcus maitriensis]|uniref:DNA-3-methyladenine glycosylase I n=1 Tax=Planococcus maitriensis TaxID=221799 RepID=A0A365K314_9BACL|nr:DNA-3-methyladenine glycosylase I [Planococcus maitriensis]RAZ67004.1 DNA-3-methyladenine glycosylase I [Planococcus maitriensis]
MAQCAWPKGDEMMQAYHDKEWCRPSRDDRYLFEMLSLEGAQAGLSWQIVLSKRGSYKDAFRNFDIGYCAGLTDEELADIKEQHGVIKHGAKLESVRTNARAVKALQSEFTSFAAYLWSFTDGKAVINEWQSDGEIPAQSELSVKISKELKKRGFKFVGPVTAYSFLQAIGMIDDHLIGCPFHTMNRK